MAQFTCGSCAKTYKAPDSLVGKRVQCPSCKAYGIVPASAPTELAKAVQQAATRAAQNPKPAEPPKNHSADAVMEDLLAEDRRAREAAKATLINFDCVFCGDPIEVAAELAGKRHPCPSCSRIVQVPVPKVADPSDWRAKNKMASAIKLDVEKGPDGAWDVTGSKGVSREALEEANALPVRPVKKVPLATRLKTFGLIGLLLLVGGLIAFQFMGRRAKRLEVQAVENLLTEGAKDAEFSKNRILLACLEISGADALLGSTAEPQPDKALKHYSQALRALQDAPASASRDFVLGQLALSIASRVGDKQKSADPKRLSSDDGHRVLREAISRINDPEIQLDAWEQVSKALVKDHQGQRAATLARQVFGTLSGAQETRNRERLNMPVEGLGIAGIALLRESMKSSDPEAQGLAKQIAQEVVKKLDAKSLVPERGVALAVGSGESYPGTWNEAKRDPELWGLAYGKALLGKTDEANAIAARSEGDQVDRIRAKVAVQLGRDPAQADPKEVVEAAAQAAASKPVLASTLLRLARLGEEANWPAATVASLAQPFAASPAGSAEAEIRGEILFIVRRLNARQGGEPPAMLAEDRAWTARSAARRDLDIASSQGDTSVPSAGYFGRLGQLLSPDSK